MMSWVAIRGFAGSYENVASVMCWGCPATPPCGTWRRRRPRIEGAAVVPRPRGNRCVPGGHGSAGWTRLTVRDGEKGPVQMEMVKRRVQTRLERKRTGPEEWLVVTRRPLADDNGLGAQASRDATDQDTRYRYHYYLTPP